MANDQESTFSLNLDGNVGEKSREDVAALEKVRASLHGASDNIKAMSAALRSLKGDTLEVTSARKELKAKLDVERAAVSAGNLALLKQGTTYEKLAADARKFALEEKNVAAAAEKAAAAQSKKIETESIEAGKTRLEGLERTLATVGGPLHELVGGFKTLQSTLGASGIALGAIVGITALVTVGILALGKVIVSATESFARWAIEGADAARSMDLVRESATGSAENARNLGTQVDALALKVPTAKKELNELAAELRRKNPWLSGKEIVSTFNLVAQAAAGANDSVGKTFEDIATRGARMQRLQIMPQELLGTGVKFDDVAKNLAASMKIGVAEARQALYQGRAPLAQGIEALRATVESRFGEINARKMLSLDVAAEKFHETISALTKDIKLEPLLIGIKKLMSYFGESTVAGHAMHELVTILGNGLITALQASLPIAKAFLKGLVIGALDVTIALLRMRASFIKAFPDDAAGKVSGTTTALQAAVLPLEALAKSFEVIGHTLELVSSLSGTRTGAALGTGLKQGIEAAFPSVTAAAKAMGYAADSALSSSLEVRSPSKVGQRIGVAVPEGVAIGIRGGTPDVARASKDVGQTAASGISIGPQLPSTPIAPARGGGGGGNRISVSIHVHGGEGGKEAAKQLSAPSFIAQFTDVIEQVLDSQGVPSRTMVLT